MSQKFQQLVEELDRSVFEFLKYARANSLDEELNAVRHSLIRFSDWMKSTAKEADASAAVLQENCGKIATDASDALTGLASLEKRVSALEQRFNELKSFCEESLAHLGERITALEGSVGDLRHASRRKPEGSVGPKPIKPIVAFGGRPGPPTYESFELEGVGGSKKRIVVELLGKYFAEQNGRLVVGSSSSHANLCVNDRSVDPKHASVTVRNRRLYVQDLGSSSGTMINGEPIKAFLDCPVSVGDTVTFGDLRLRVRTPTGKPSLAETRVGYTRILGR